MAKMRSSYSMHVPKRNSYLQKFRANVHSFADTLLLFRILALATVIPALIRWLSMRRLLDLLTPGNASNPFIDSQEEYASKIAKYADFILGRGIWVYKRNCLKRSLILYHFMRKTGIDVQLCLGVKTNQNNEKLHASNDLDGHAWLVFDGQPWQERALSTTEAYTITYCFPEENLGTCRT